MFFNITNRTHQSIFFYRYTNASLSSSDCINQTRNFISDCRNAQTRVFINLIWSTKCTVQTIPIIIKNKTNGSIASHFQMIWCRNILDKNTLIIFFFNICKNIFRIQTHQYKVISTTGITNCPCHLQHIIPTFQDSLINNKFLILGLSS